MGHYILPLFRKLQPEVNFFHSFNLSFSLFLDSGLHSILLYFHQMVMSISTRYATIIDFMFHLTSFHHLLNISTIILLNINPLMFPNNFQYLHRFASLTSHLEIPGISNYLQDISH